MVPVETNANPPDTLAPQLVARTTGLDRRGRVRLTLTCPVAERTCGGSAELLSARKLGKYRVLFGSRSFGLAGGATTTLTIKLARESLSLIRKRRSVRAVFAIVAADAAGNRAKRSLKVTLKVPKR